MAPRAPLTEHGLAELRKLLESYLVLRPCHVTGLHSPDHQAEQPENFCEIQKAAAIEEVLELIGLDWSKVRRDLHDEGDCYWCHHVPGQEEYRSRLRKTWAWAGREIPDDLAALADDAPRPDDDILVLEVLTPEWQRWGDCVEQFGLAPLRFQKAALKLIADGVIERTEINCIAHLRLRPKEVLDG